MSNINTLRNTLFEVLTEIRSGDVTVEEVKAINDTAQTIINTAKLEIAHAKAVRDGNPISQFVSDQSEGVVEPNPDNKYRMKKIIDKRGISSIAEGEGVTITRHIAT